MLRYAVLRYVFLAHVRLVHSLRKASRALPISHLRLFWMRKNSHLAPFYRSIVVFYKNKKRRIPWRKDNLQS